jgi:23S rRNA (guanosine2251-2'-O)-methyltransferase
VEVEGGTLTAVAGFDGHQGIALVVEPRVYAGLDDVLARAVERGEPPFVLVLDSLEDPQNVGTLLRSAEAAGVHGVLFPTHRQAPLSAAAIKASAGAVEHLLLCPVDDLPAALSDLRIRGLRVAAAEADAPLTTAQADLRGPLAIVVGSEGQGLSPVVRRRADVAVRIPMRGAIGSLNAAVAGSILLFAAVAQRDPGGEGGGSERPRPATFDEIAAATAAESGRALPAVPASDEEPSTSPDEPALEAPPTARKRARPPAPTTAAQKRARAGKKAVEPDAEPATAAEAARPSGPVTADQAEPTAAEPGPVPARRRTKESLASAETEAATTDAAVMEEPDSKPEAGAKAAPRRRARAAPVVDDGDVASGVEDAAGTKPAAGTKAATRRRAKAGPPAEGEAPVDDLLPGGPPAD